VEARQKEGPREGDPGILAASGMIAGEGLAGVAIAALVASKQGNLAWGRWLDSWHFASKDFTFITGPAGVVIGIALVLGVAALLYRAGRSGEAEP
jgi:hypothetical protein